MIGSSRSERSSPGTPKGSTSRRRWMVVISGIGVGVVVLAALTFPGRDSPAGEQPLDGGTSGAADLAGEMERRLAEPGRPVPVAEMLPALSSAIEALQSRPGIEVSYRALGTDAGPVEGRAFVDTQASELSMQESTALDATSVVGEQRRVVDGVIYVRAMVGTDDSGVLWDAVPVDALPDRDIDRVYVAAGRTPSLDRLLEIAQAAAFPGSVPEIPPELLRDVRAAVIDGGYRLMVPVAVAQAFESYEGEGESDDHDVGVFEFRLDGGVLVGLTAYGWLVQDTEPIGPALVEVAFDPMADRPRITVPPADQVRS